MPRWWWLQAAAGPETKSRPFPWRCFRCRDRAVVPVTMPYAVKVTHDGESHVIEIPALDVPRFQSCGELVFDNAADEQINAAIRLGLRLLTPAEVHAGWERLGLTSNGLAERLGVPKKTIADWEDGMAIQSRALDNLLRVYFELPEVRAMLTGKQQDPQLGVLMG